MRIALNMGNLRGQGSRQVGQGIRAGLLAAGVDVAHAWIPTAWSDPDLREGVSRVRSGFISKLVADNVSLRRGLRRVGASCLFSLGDTGTIRPPVPHLLLVQQAFLAYTPAELDFPLTAPFRAKLALMSKYFQAGISGVTHFTVQTEDMKRRLAARWGLAAERISVVPSAVDDTVLEFAERTRAPSADDPYLCYLAGANSYKNHEVLAPVMARVRRHYPRVTCHLTVRPEGVPALSAAARRLGVFDAFVFHGELSRRASMELLAGARAAIIPSKLESFGIPYYEAMALGVPVIAADRPFAREACGDAALYAGADDAASFAEHVGAVLDGKCATLGSSGQERFRCARQDWHQVGARYLRLAEAIC